MLGRPRNRRKPAEARRRFRAAGDQLALRSACAAGVLAVLACGTAGVLLGARTSPSRRSRSQGRFQRVPPADVERVVKTLRARRRAVVASTSTHVRRAVRHAALGGRGERRSAPGRAA